MIPDKTKRAPANKERAAVARNKWIEANPEKNLASKKKYEANNKDKKSEYGKIRYQANKVRLLAICKKYREENQGKVLASTAKWRENNKEKIAAYAARYHAAAPAKALANCRKYQAGKMNRTPEWADMDAINLFYENRPEGFHVDHIIPLRGKYVSGLHVENNLQWLSASENLRKGNRWPE